MARSRWLPYFCQWQEMRWLINIGIAFGVWKRNPHPPPPRVIAFGWRAILGAILAMGNLRHRRVIIVNACLMCLTEEESIDHLLLNCSISQRLWKAIFSWFHVASPLSQSFSSLFQFWRFGVGPRRGRSMWNLCFLANIWTIWREKLEVLWREIYWSW